MLMKAFEDLSSVDEDLDDIEAGNPVHHDAYDGQVPAFPFLEPAQTSTPINKFDGNFRNTDSSKRNHSAVSNGEQYFPKQNGHHPDGVSHHDKGASSPEGHRDANDFSSGYHLQALLDQNEKLSNESNMLKHRISVAAGDFDGLSHKFKEIEKAYATKDDECIKLEGKCNALEAQLRSERDAKNESLRKLALAESTIESLHDQIKDIARSDCMSRVQETHEAVMTKLKRSYESIIVTMKGEVDGLKTEVDLKKQELAETRASLRLLKSQPDNNFNAEHAKQMATEMLNIYKRDIEARSKTLIDAELKRGEEEFERNKRELETRTKKHIESELKRAEEELERNKRELETRAKMHIEAELKRAEADFERKKREHEALSRMQIEAKLKQAEAEFERNKLSIVVEAKADWNRELVKQVDDLKDWLESFLTTSQPPDNEIQALLLPLQRLWISFQHSCGKIEEGLVARRDELREAQQALEDAVHDSKHLNESNKDVILQTANEELDALKRESAEFRSKLKKYKRKYHFTLEEQRKEIELMRQEYTALLTKNEDRDLLFQEKLANESKFIASQFNEAYARSLAKMNKHMTELVEDSNRRSLQKVAKAVIAYHELVTRKIAEREGMLKRHLDESRLHLVDESCKMSMISKYLEPPPPVLLDTEFRRLSTSGSR